MKLHELKNVKGAIHRKKRVGCGEGGGHGKTSGRGGKGQSARSGSSIRPGFEGGQLPHRGFKQFNFRTEIAILNVGDLSGLYASVTEVSVLTLADAGLIRSGEKAVKILGDGELTRAMKVTAAKFSESAKAKIEKAGGQAIVG